MLRSLNERDISELVTIELATQASPWSEEIFKQCLNLGSLGWVIEINQRIVAFVLLLVKMGEGHILNIAVSPEHQHQGHGYLLMNKILQKAIEEALSIVYLEVRESNLPAIALYKKMGFKQIAVRKGYYALSESREDGLVFTKEF